MIGKKLTLFLALFLFSITLATAADLTFPINEQIDIKRPCFNNGTFCSGSAVCNMTVFYPDGKLLLNNNLSTNQGSFHNITVEKAENIRFGPANGLMTCYDPAGDIKGNGLDTFSIEFTGDGAGFNVFPTQFIILILGVVLIVTGKLKEDLNIMKTVGSMVVLVMGVITLYPGYSFLNHSNLLGQSIGFSAIAFGAYFLVEGSFSRKKQAPTVQQDWEEVDDGRFHGN